MQTLKTTINNEPYFDELGNCFQEIVNGTTIQQNEASGIPITRIETIQKSVFDMSRVKYIKNPTQEIISKYQYQVGDIALSNINSLEHVGKVAIYEGKPERLLHGMNLLRLRPNKDILLPKYAYFYMLGNMFRGEVKKRVGKAVNQVSINQKNLKEVPFLVVPISEQKIIIQKLGKLLPLIDKSTEQIQKSKKQIKRFRQSILNAAITGKLTEDWRLGKQLIAADVVHVDESINAAEIPNSWVVCNFGNLIQDGPQNGLYKPQSDYGNGTMILRIGNFYDGEINDWGSLKRLNVSKDELIKYSIHNNDIIINRVNSVPYLGKTAIVRNLQEDCVFESNMMRMSINNFALPEFVNLYFQSALGKQQIKKNAKLAINQASINQEDVKSAQILVPSIEEQFEIVKRINSYFMIIDKVEKIVETAEKKVSKLTQAVLTKTFSN